MHPHVRRGSLLALALVVSLFASCRAATGLFIDPPAKDPLDGYEGSLAEAGINTEMDWGPKQNLLLSQFQTLKEAHKRLEDRVEKLLAENQNLTSRLSSESGSLQKEKTLRAQAEAETEQLRQRRRDLEARVLGLSIEKAKLEQANLKARIDQLSASMDQNSSAPAEAAATPPRGRE
jgi:chromosome segregation ATPase